MSDNKKRTVRVVSSNGSAWQTSAQGAADYLFNPVFMTFFILCVVLYATLMQPSEQTSLPIPAQMVLWGGLIMTSLIWLFFSVWASIFAYEGGLLKAIYTPMILLPLVLINTFMGNFILSVFNEAYQGSYGTMLESIVQNSIILITFDIMHARFVAPQHPKYLSDHSLTTSEGVASDPIDLAAYKATAGAPPAIAPVSRSEAEPVESTLSDISRPKFQNHVEIARKRFEASAIQWVKSEDHYLSIQLKDQNIMLRGKLRAAVDELGDLLGAQINRSIWVAFSAIRTVEEQTSGSLDVHLEDESVHRVVNTRRLIFKQNYDRFKAEMASCRVDQQAEG